MYVPITKYPWGGSFCPEAFAEAKLTGSGLKFRLWCCEKHPRVTMTKPNSLVCLDSCLEVFLNPYPDFTRDYLNFEMNAAGTLLLQKGPDRAHRSFVNLAVPHYPQVHAWQLPDVWGVELEHFGNADAVPQPPERCLSRQAGIVRCCPNYKVVRRERIRLFREHCSTSNS